MYPIVDADSVAEDTRYKLDEVPNMSFIPTHLRNPQTSYDTLCDYSRSIIWRHNRPFQYHRYGYLDDQKHVSTVPEPIHV